MYRLYLYDESNIIKLAELNTGRSGICDVMRAQLTDELDGQIMIEINPNLLGEKAPMISAMKWIRLIDDSDDTETSFRLENIEHQRSGGVLRGTWTAENIKYLLRDFIVKGYHPFIDALPQVIIETILEGTGFTLDVVDFTDPISVTLDWNTALEALEMMKELTGGYLIISEDKKVSLLEEIGEDNGVRVEYRRNLTGITRTIDCRNIANRIYPRGAIEEGVRFSPEGYEENPGYVEDTEAQETLGGDGDPIVKEAPLVDERFVNIINLVKTPNFSGDYTDGLCQDWEDLGIGAPGFEENRDLQYLKPFGSKSQKVSGDGAGSGIKQDITIENGKHYSAFFWVYVASGSVAMRIKKGTGYSESAVTSGPGFIFAEIAGILSDDTTGGIEIFQNGEDAAEFYCTAVQLIQHYENKGTDGLVIGDNRANLITLAERELELRKNPQITYEVNFKDLYAADPGGYPFDAFRKGDRVTIRDGELGIDVKLQAQSKDIDLMNPYNVTVRFGVKKKDLSHYFKLISQRTGIKFEQETFF